MTIDIYRPTDAILEHSGNIQPATISWYSDAMRERDGTVMEMTAVVPDENRGISDFVD